MVVIKMVTLQLLLHVDQQQNARESEFDNTQVLKAQNLICMLPSSTCVKPIVYNFVYF
jgi:hypothetical protein